MGVNVGVGKVFFEGNLKVVNVICNVDVDGL